MRATMIDAQQTVCYEACMHSFILRRRAIILLVLCLAPAYSPFQVAAAPIYFPDRQYHSAWGKVGQLKDKKLPACVEHDPRGFDLLFVEFDERGDFWDRDQLADDSHAIKTAAAKGKQILLIEYVHGWHNNALDDDPGRDVDRFRQLLSVVARSKLVEEMNYRVMAAAFSKSYSVRRKSICDVSKSQYAPGSPKGVPTLPALTTRTLPIVRSNCMWVWPQTTTSASKAMKSDAIRSSWVRRVNTSLGFRGVAWQNRILPNPSISMRSVLSIC